MSDTHLSRIRGVLASALSPLELDVEDESAMHAGHAGASARPDGGITHLRVRVASEAFRGKSRLERHRMVSDLLAEEIANGLHAFAIQAKAPGE